MLKLTLRRFAACANAFTAAGLVAITMITLCLYGELTIAADSDISQSEGQSKARLDRSTGQTNAVPDANSVDELITNAKLRAQSGSKSRWSIASQFNYLGSTIDNPLAENRPDISGASATTAKADLDGSVSAKYNLDATKSVLAGLGIRWIAPLERKGPSNYSGTTYDAMNPYLTYQYIYNWLGVQSVLQVQGMVWTQSDVTALGYAQQASVDQEFIYEIGKSGVSLGTSLVGQYNWFNKSGTYKTTSGDAADMAAQQSVYSFAFAPVLEYKINDRFNLRTLVALWTIEHYASESNALTFARDQAYQSIGLGVAMTRDIFLYPNVQFLPDQIQSAKTNVGLNATINVF